MTTLTANRPDKETVRLAAHGRWAHIILALTGIDPAVLDGHHHPCPMNGCGGTDRFRVFGDFDQNGGVICNQCHREKNGDGFATIKKATGCSFSETVERVADHLGLTSPNVGPNGQTKLETGEDGNKTVLDTLQAKRISLESGRAYGVEMARRGDEWVATFPMYDTVGKRCSRFAMSWNSPNEKLRKGMNETGKPAGLFLPHDSTKKVRLPQPGENGSSSKESRTRPRCMASATAP